MQWKQLLRNFPFVHSVSLNWLGYHWHFRMQTDLLWLTIATSNSGCNNVTCLCAIPIYCSCLKFLQVPKNRWFELSDFEYKTVQETRQIENWPTTAPDMAGYDRCKTILSSTAPQNRHKNLVWTSFTGRQPASNIHNTETVGILWATSIG